MKTTLRALDPRNTRTRGDKNKVGVTGAFVESRGSESQLIGADVYEWKAAEGEVMDWSQTGLGSVWKWKGEYPYPNYDLWYPKNWLDTDKYTGRLQDFDGAFLIVDWDDGYDVPIGMGRPHREYRCMGSGWARVLAERKFQESGDIGAEEDNRSVAHDGSIEDDDH